MSDFQFYSPEDVISSNLQEIYSRMNMLCEQELAHLQELAAEITADLEDDTAFAFSLADLLPTEDRPLARDEDAIKKRYEERYGIYCSAADVIVAVNEGPEETAQKIIKEMM